MRQYGKTENNNNKRKKRKNIENKHQNDRCKPSHINNYIKYEWTNHFNNKAKILRLDIKKPDFPTYYL